MTSVSGNRRTSNTTWGQRETYTLESVQGLILILHRNNNWISNTTTLLEIMRKHYPAANFLIHSHTPPQLLPRWLLAIQKSSLLAYLSLPLNLWFLKRIINLKLFKEPFGCEWFIQSYQPWFLSSMIEWSKIVNSIAMRSWTMQMS